MNLKNVTLSLAVIAAVACKKDAENVTSSNPAFDGDIKSLVAPDGFDFNTVSETEANVSVKDLDNLPLEGIRVDFFSADPIEGGELISTARTDKNGEVKSLLRVPTYLNEVFVRVAYHGFANTAFVDSKSNINLSFGGAQAPHAKGKTSGSMSNARIPISGNYYYFGTFNSNGLPDYLDAPDNLSAGFLADVNASLPEGQPVPTYNPSYLASGNQLDIVVTDMSDVWVTFVAEGANYKNALGYYVYDSNNPPSSTSQIDSIFVLFPNASFTGAGGDMNAGDKVYLGTFPGGKTISWVLFQDAWTGSGVDVYAQKFYSTVSFNPENNSSYRQHNVQLSDNSRDLLLNGFEDLHRQRSNRNPDGYITDNDFNDLIFYVTANPWDNIDTTGTPDVTDGGDDEDGDGVDDDEDEFPNDPDRAYTNDFDGTLAYEDLWPSEGDYDFNDLVVDYSITEVSNASNEVVDVLTEWTVKAIGASYKNGFGWMFENVSGSEVSSVSGQTYTESYISNSGNGTEAGQSNATIVVFDNATAQMPKPGTAFVNTVPGEATVSPYTYSVDMTFSTPQDPANLGTAPYNPFIIVDRDRDVEVHLTNNVNTDLADVNLFGTNKDDTDPGSGEYYINANNLPWAIHIEGGFDYPVEYAPITDAYNNFAAWAMSGGTSFPDWYLDLSGYRNSAYIY